MRNPEPVKRYAILKCLLDWPAGKARVKGDRWRIDMVHGNVYDRDINALQRKLSEAEATAFAAVFNMAEQAKTIERLTDDSDAVLDVVAVGHKIADQAKSIKQLQSQRDKAIVWIDKAMDTGELDKQYIHMGHAKQVLVRAALEDTRE